MCSLNVFASKCEESLVKVPYEKYLPFFNLSTEEAIQLGKPLWLGEMFTLVGYVARVNIQRALEVGGDREDFKSARLVALHAPTRVRTPDPKLKTPTRTNPCQISWS